MSETPLDYDRMIWEVFAIGVVYSVMILYFFHKGYLSKNLEILSLIFGFSVWVYSFSLVLGYNFKKKRLLEVTEDKEIKLLKKDLKNKCYVRTRWMGEIILILIGFYYFVSFQKKWIPIIIILIAFILCSTANYSANNH